MKTKTQLSRAWVTILFFFSSCPFVSAQELPKLQQILSRGSLPELNAYILRNDEVYRDDLSDNRMYWRIYREISPGYFEGVLQIFYAVPVNRIKHYVHPFRVEVLVRDSAIIQYRLKGIDSSGRYQSFKDSGSKQNALIRFEEDYAAFYGARSRSELMFVDSISYNYNCLRPLPSQSRDLAQILLAGDRNLLSRWLRSGNTELQLYAVKGFELMPDWLDEQSLRLIRFVLGKEGNANVCWKGYERRIQISELKESFSFTE